MKIISWNVNGLRAAVKKGFVDYIKTENPDIICVQETKLQVEQIPAEVSALTDYHQYWACAEKKGYSGTALFSKQKPLQVLDTLGEKIWDREGRTLIAEFTDFVLINTYYPNGQMNETRLAYKLAFYDHIIKIFNKYTAAGKKLLFCGDVNTAHNPIDLARPKANEKTSGYLRIERDWLDKICAQGYIDTFRHFFPETVKYSWWSYRASARARNVGWRLDYFFCNPQMLNQIENAFIRNEQTGSDHCPVGVIIKEKI